MSQTLWDLNSKPLSKKKQEVLIEKAVEILESVYLPFRIYLFGSFARCEATDSSDIDFLLILNTDDEVRHAWRQWSNVTGRLGSYPCVDLLFRSRRELEGDLISGPAEIAIDEGVLVFDSNRSKSSKRAASVNLH